MTADATQRRWRDADGEHIDVRGLPPPQPLVAILRLVHEQGDAGGATVIVHFDRDPQLLHSELAEIGWVAERIDAEPGEVRLRLFAPQSLRSCPQGASSGLGRPRAGPKCAP